MATENVCLEFQSVSMEFSGVKALKNVSFSISSQEVRALIGANGAGKSTLIKILARIYRQTGGDILLHGKSLSEATPDTIRDQGIEFIFQELELIPEFTVAQNMLIGREPRRGGLIDWKKMNEEAQKALDDFLPGAIKATDLVSSLPVAKQQIVCIVRALHRNPQILVLDEPTSRLSASETDILFDAIRKMREKKEFTIIYISHHLEEIFKICDSITILRDGRNVGTWPLSEITQEQIVHHMVGDLSASNKSNCQKHTHDGVPALSVKGLGQPGLFKDISFDVYPGEILSLTGAVGAKKTEIFETLMGIRQGAVGTVAVFGEPYSMKDPYEALARNICLISEDRRKYGVVSEYSVRENLTVSIIKRFTNKLGLLQTRKEKQFAEDMVSRVNIKTPSTENLVKNLSGGNIQKVVVGKWIAKDSSIYLFDEPTVGIDVKGKSEIYSLIRELADAGKAVIVATSEIEEAVEIGDEIIVLYNGRIVDRRSADTADKEKIVRLTMGVKDDE